MNPLRSVGARLSLALVGVVLLALGLVYLVVVPSLRNRLIDAKLTQLRRAMLEIRKEVPQTQFQWTENLQVWSARSDARVVIYSIDNTATPERRAFISPKEDSFTIDSRDVNSDSVAQRAADTFKQTSGTVRRGDEEFAEVADHVASSLAPSSGAVVLLSASLNDALNNVHTVQRRVVEAGLLALAVALVLGYWMASLFARRIARLEAAAERIAAGHFDEPIVDRRMDELGELARAFDRMRLRLSRLDHARREFVGNASHELRTPLFSLGGFIELLTDEDLDEATRREFLETMGEQVQRLQRMAEDLLDLTRLDAGRMHLERTTVDLAEVAQDLGEEFRAVAASTAHPLEVEALEARALGDDERILRIGRALLENALKHTAPGTRVRVRSSGTTLSVEDDGPGVDPEHAGHIFDRFYRVDGARASGSGLGLAIARELATAMDGTLELAARDGWTRFMLRLPPATDEAAAFPRENVTALNR